MQLMRNRPERNGGAYPDGRSVVAIGNFDGIHLGHQALINRSRELASGSDAVVMLTFEPLPQAFFRPGQAPPRLSTVYQKLEMLQSLGVDFTWLMRFTQEFAQLTAREFVELVLVRRLKASHIVVGEDFRFGRGREGEVAMLRSLGSEFDFEVTIVPAVLHDGKRISSSQVRASLAAGDFATAAAMLGRPFRMEGHVVRGAGLGKKLGYPTANLRIRSRSSPLGGVFAAFSRIGEGAWLPAVTNLGRRPAVGGKEPLLEVHFFDFDEDIYGQRLEVEFVAKLRDELNFDSLDDLVTQMKQDELEARAKLAETQLPETQLPE